MADPLDKPSMRKAFLRAVAAELKELRQLKNLVAGAGISIVRNEKGAVISVTGREGGGKGSGS